MATYKKDGKPNLKDYQVLPPSLLMHACEVM
jgi:hypothetical protein